MYFSLVALLHVIMKRLAASPQEQQERTTSGVDKGINFNFKFHFPLFKLDFLRYLNVILLHLLYYSDT